jgi:hypothetical protein
MPQPGSQFHSQPECQGYDSVTRQSESSTDPCASGSGRDSGGAYHIVLDIADNSGRELTLLLVTVQSVFELELELVTNTARPRSHGI